MVWQSWPPSHLLTTPTRVHETLGHLNAWCAVIGREVDYKNEFRYFLSHWLFVSVSSFLVVLQADYLQPKLLGILAFFNMQLLSSSAGEKDRKKLVSV